MCLILRCLLFLSYNHGTHLHGQLFIVFTATLCGTLLHGQLFIEQNTAWIRAHTAVYIGHQHNSMRPLCTRYVHIYIHNTMRNKQNGTRRVAREEWKRTPYFRLPGNKQKMAINLDGK
eukprot:GEMP01068531.1.p1 GENE.GEMP01068531.1~~GEMP01068531.1.p1  ORF type:complete len:118 (-),score=1.86 GEMP01068531.1:510-863(-)